MLKPLGVCPIGLRQLLPQTFGLRRQLTLLVRRQRPQLGVEGRPAEAPPADRASFFYPKKAKLTGEYPAPAVDPIDET